MTRKYLPSPELLRKLLRYEPETGKLFWEKRDPSDFNNNKAQNPQHTCKSWNSQYAGRQAFTSVNAKGYNQSNIFASNFEAHRVCWAIFFAAYPEGEIDHINGIKTDNRIRNLRDVTSSENKMNRGKQKNNTSGVTGVMWFTPANLWTARIMHNKKVIDLGYFRNFEDAVLARRKAEKKYGYSERHGKS